MGIERRTTGSAARGKRTPPASALPRPARTPLVDSMSDDEMFAALVCLAIVLTTWLRWIYVAFALHHVSAAPGAALVPPFACIVASAAVFGVLANFASHDVRDSTTYLGFYLLMGAAVTAFGVSLLDRLGLSLRDDVLERRNPAACLAWSGAVLGLALAFAGANIGDGPGWWVVVFSAGLSVGALLLGWLLLDRLGGCAEAILVERDQAAALRVAAWFVAVGAINGRAAAGDWVSVSATVTDFGRVASGGFALTVLAAFVESVANRVPPATEADRTNLLRAALPSLLVLGLAALYLVWLGRW